MTQKFTFRALAFSLFIFSASHIYSAGNHGIGVTLVDYTIDSSNRVDLGYTININAEVTNFDSVPFMGVLSFGLRDSTHTLTTADIFSQPPYSGDSISLSGNESVPAIFSVNVNADYFMPGPDVVVVWPICNKPEADSIVIRFVITDPNGISNQTDAPVTYVVKEDKILLRGLNGKTNFKQVRIYNMIGQQLSEIHSAQISDIQLPTLPSGIYLCELTELNGNRITFKFLH